MLDEEDSGELTDAEYIAVREHAMPLIRSVIGGMMAEESLDAIVYPTSPTRPQKADPDPNPGGAPGGGGSPVILANLSGFPDLIVPAGFTGRGLPVSISFLGTAFSEAKLLALGYAFEQRTKARRLPATTPALQVNRSTIRRNDSDISGNQKGRVGSDTLLLLLSFGASCARERVHMRIPHHFIALAFVLLFAACAKEEAPMQSENESAEPENPLLVDSGLPYGAPAFDKIKNEHFAPALEHGMAEQAAEIELIASNPESATFENTIEPWRRRPNARAIATHLWCSN